MVKKLKKDEVVNETSENTTTLENGEVVEDPKDGVFTDEVKAATEVDIKNVMGVFNKTAPLEEIDKSSPEVSNNEHGWMKDVKDRTIKQEIQGKFISILDMLVNAVNKKYNLHIKESSVYSYYQEDKGFTVVLKNGKKYNVGL